jgi:hypothetical protein
MLSQCCFNCFLISAYHFYIWALSNSIISYYLPLNYLVNSEAFINLHLTLPQDRLHLFIRLPTRASQDDSMTSTRSLLSLKKRVLNMWWCSWWLAVATWWPCLPCWSSDSPVCCLGLDWCLLFEVSCSSLVAIATSCPCLNTAAAWIRSSVLSIARKRFSRLVVANISTCTSIR